MALGKQAQKRYSKKPGNPRGKAFATMMMLPVIVSGTAIAGMLITAGITNIAIGTYQNNN